MENPSIILGTRKGLFLLNRSSGSWNIASSSFAGAPVSYAAVDPRTGALWACLDHGHWGAKLHRSFDQGASWQELPAPKYPEGSEISAGVAAALKYLWVFAPGGVDQPQTVYLGTEPGGLFRSDDYGESFYLVEGLWNHPSRLTGWFGGGRDYAGIHSIVVDPRNSKRVLIAVSCAGVFETLDDGLTWEPRNKGLSAEFLPNPDAEVGQDPHLMAVCDSSPDILWQQNHCGIFRSIDGAATWNKVSQSGGPAYFGFPVAVDPDNGDTAWVVPAAGDEFRIAIEGALCVCRTQDGGETWTTHREGLPQEHCFDVVFRHALDIHGDSLVFGSTTGNLFISNDRGDSWQCLGNYFPPIYSVRFGDLS